MTCMNCQNSKTTFYSKSELDLIVCTFIRYIRKGKKYHIIAPFFGHLSSVSRAIFEVLWICCHRIFLPIVAVFALTTALWYQHCLLFFFFFTSSEKMIIFSERERAKETNGTKVWCMAWLKTNSRPQGVKRGEIIFLSTRCFLLMQFSKDQLIQAYFSLLRSEKLHCAS